MSQARSQGSRTLKEETASAALLGVRGLPGAVESVGNGGGIRQRCVKLGWLPSCVTGGMRQLHSLVLLNECMFAVCVSTFAGQHTLRPVSCPILG